ncbi:hypothetical protein LWP59_04235 [Amycolatopsis acidiphila]|uniref:DUF2269 family protein n=1 Tax=Amycolatopsis acidiphila TaxID=715473 RepID=A0A557ZWU7_9PSEU|nr:hypothetical protein [Amycolatopsis acidiphila]TVT16487.1 hypothetical protein FNH06_34525 [Amycolatopsis acidiphila]UIJ60889.1 hypothetical protein LWP59_04235 [Amycolatopsis acidiphila]GHG95023.1 hypothetical protein GCM10017788_73270 [Amycolatopsis acidiphila]
MTKVLLSVHVLAAIVLIGPVTVAASLFPRHARAKEVGVLRVLHRISTGYAVAGLAVPVFGIALAGQMHVLGDAWLVISMALTAVAALLLALVIVPGQRRVLAALEKDENAGGPNLGMVTGLFALAWAVVVVLMIVRPGSTTGV